MANPNPNLSGVVSDTRGQQDRHPAAPQHGGRTAAPPGPLHDLGHRALHRPHQPVCFLLLPVAQGVFQSFSETGTDLSYKVSKYSVLPCKTIIIHACKL